MINQAPGGADGSVITVEFLRVCGNITGKRSVLRPVLKKEVDNSINQRSQCTAHRDGQYPGPKQVHRYAPPYRRQALGGTHADYRTGNSMGGTYWYSQRF